MTAIICKPSEVDFLHLEQIVQIIKAGNEVSHTTLRNGIDRADLIAYIMEGNLIISTATLKNPLASYRQKVFENAKVEINNNGIKELGYISTLKNYEGKGFCQKLLKRFFEVIPFQPIYATTRKQSMIHILGKFCLKVEGQTYNSDLCLLTNFQ